VLHLRLTDENEGCVTNSAAKTSVSALGSETPMHGRPDATAAGGQAGETCLHLPRVVARAVEVEQGFAPGSGALRSRTLARPQAWLLA
jgi:hypothetical protein